MLRTHKLGEADRIVTMLSRNHGKIRAVAKGVRRTASKFGARLEPFMVADVQLYEGRSLDIITQAESLGSYGAEITADYGSYTAASVMVETADKITDDDGSLQQYLLLVGALRSLARREHGSSVTLDSYLLRSLSIAGWAPSFVDCAVTGAPGPHTVFVA
ncbi:MAG: recO, partial [Microbacteriaceae bacterium]|nr:recO [Microbacteriaceae bacterium]